MDKCPRLKRILNKLQQFLYCIYDTVPFEAVSKVLGHTTKDTIQRYAKLDLEGLRQCALEVAPASGKFQFWLTGGQNG